MKCPGQDTRYWKAADIFEAKCPDCGRTVEFFKDDTNRKCKYCGAKVLNPKIDFGCATYCKYAEQCLKDMPPDFIAQRNNMLKDQVAVEMKKYFMNDFKRIGHATRVARYAERISKNEKGDMAVVLIAAYLHDIGIREAEQKYNSSASVYQEELGPPVARKILEELGAFSALIDEVCDIIGHHHHPRFEETDNFKALSDADLIVNLEDKHKKKPFDHENLSHIIETKMFTDTGKKLAKGVFEYE